MRVKIKLIDEVGEFAEDKDKAKRLRTKFILPAIENGNFVALDFSGMSGATQSFIHALIAEPIMKYRDRAFEKLVFVDTNQDISEIISIVYRYLQESFEDIY